MAIRVSKTHFTKANKVFSADAPSGGMTPVVRALLQAQAKIAASAVSALTDSSGGGTADGTINAIGNVTLAALGSSDAAALSTFNTAASTATDAIKELIAQANAIHAKVPAMDGTLTDNLSGTAVDGTIGAVTQTIAGASASLAKGSEVQSWFSAVTSRLTQLRYHVNHLAVACGVTPLVDSLGVADVYSTTFAAVTQPADTATGADATTNAVIKSADAAAKLVLVASAIKEIATVLNACRSATGGVMGAVAFNH
jgi:hypothetical protein